MDKFVRIIGVLALAMILLFALSVFNSERNGTISNDTFWGFITGICLAFAWIVWRVKFRRR